MLFLLAFLSLSFGIYTLTYELESHSLPFSPLDFCKLPITLFPAKQITNRHSACAAAIVKTVLQAGVFDNPDYTFHDSYSIWNNVELHVGIIAACLPALRPLFAALLDGAKKASRTVLGSSSAGRQHRYYIQNDSAGGIKMSSLNVPGVPSGKSKYDVKITTRSHPHSHHTQTKGSRIGSGESEEELKVTEDRDSDEIFIMNNGQGIMKSVDVTVQR